MILNGKKITASKIIIASHYPFSNIRGLYVSKIYQERAYSTVSAMVLKDLIVKGSSPWAEVYNPSRFIESNAGSINNDIEKGQGNVVDIDGQKLGAYKDEDGKLYLVNTTCIHMGCEVKWNGAERTWDGLCHGSRFSPNGDVIEGPAYASLERIKIQ